MSRQITDITDDTFEAEVLNAKVPVLLDFWADWCGPCKALAPVLSDLAEDYSGEVRICKINADTNPLTADRFGVRGLPTMILFKQGEEHDRLVGLTTRSRIATTLDAAL